MREQSRNDEDLGIRYLRMALEYGRATRALLDASQCEAPFWHCGGHALELSLKSLLKKHGFDEMDLMQFINHDLYRAERSGTVRNSVCGRAVEHYAAMALM
ncbi:hypothetical protein, partial [Novosphingobium resinovorum]|uniref:hypothetical protein n=2 Tax=Novosphingobium TaxID=165696 RepID=UPI0022F257F9